MKKTGLTLLTALLLVTLVIFGAGTAAAAPIPFINNIVPNQGPIGTPVLITGGSFGTPDSTSSVTFNGVQAQYFSWSDTMGILTQVPTGATTGPVVVRTQGVSSNTDKVFTVTGNPIPPIPTAAQTWYLPEGSTAWGFETYLLMENTTDIDATVTIIYNTAQYGRIPRPQQLNVPPSSRVTLKVNDDIPNVDLSIEVQSTQKIVCERSIYWNNRIEGTDSIGTTTPAKSWYLAEGCTTYPFETWVCIQNPSLTSTANVDITYMTSHGVVTKPTLTVGAGQRKTLDVSKDVGQCDVSTRLVSDQNIVCERAMYWDGRRGGHASIGVAAPSKTWYLSEGSSAWGFQTWLLLQNPNSKAAKVDVTFMTTHGPVKQPTINMGANTRQTINVNQGVPNTDTSIAVSSDIEVNAERAMYWNNGTGKAGTDTIGFTAPSKSIYLAEGSTAWGFETFVCIQNPNSKPADVSVTYLTNSGAVAGPGCRVPANSRVTINVANELPNRDTSVKLMCSQPIMAERAMYWNNRGGGTASIGWVPQ